VIPALEAGNQWETIFDRALGAGVSVAYYVSDLPVPALYGPRGLEWIRPIADFYSHAAAGTLPNICFVDPPFVDGGGGDGTSADDHPLADIRLGQAFMSDVVHAFIESPQYRHGAMFLNYDEWGGFFDHVKPRRVPDDRSSPDLAEDFGLTGFRVPGVAISPYARGGTVSHAFTTHESILKLLSYRFGFGFLNKRHRYATNIGRTFDYSKPDLDPPSLSRSDRDRRRSMFAGWKSPRGHRPRQAARPRQAGELRLSRETWLRSPALHVQHRLPGARQRQAGA
jgi:phospholipase C